MESIFPTTILSLEPLDLGFRGCTALLSQADGHQILFMQFENSVQVAEHRHEAQWGYVVEGVIDLTIDGEQNTFRKGDHYFIPADVKHSAKIYPGYADITIFNSPDRYTAVKKAE